MNKVKDLLKQWLKQVGHNARPVYEGFQERYAFLRASYGGDSEKTQETYLKEIGKTVLGYDFRNEESAIFLGDELYRRSLTECNRV